MIAERIIVKCVYNEDTHLTDLDEKEQKMSSL